MKNICAWLCPPKKKNQGPYDVHEQTFEMEQNFAEIEQADKNSNPSARIQTINISEKPQSNQSLTVNSQNQDKMQNEQKKYIKNKNKIEEQPMIGEGNIVKEEGDENKMIQQQKKLRKEQEVKPEGVQQKKVQQSEEQKPKPKYNILPSSIKKKQFNPEDYYFKQEQNQFRIKAVDSLKGQQFNIDFCKNGTYFIFDITANIYVDDSENCFIFSAPCQSSLFLRNCKNMIIIAAVGQLRTYNCHNCHFSIYCKSQPVIQSSSQIYFSSLECPQYMGLRQQFKKCKLEPWNNNWSQIHNFTKKQGQTHHFLEKQPSFKFQIDWMRAYKLANLQILNQKQQIVPFIQGIFPLQEEPSQTLLIFDQQTSENDEEVYEWLRKNKIHLLKASKLKLPGQKHITLALLINKKFQQELELGKFGNAKIIIEKQELEINMSKYFITFKDQR